MYLSNERKNTWKIYHSLNTQENKTGANIY